MKKTGEIEIKVKFKVGDKGYEEVLNIPSRYRAWEVKKAFQGSFATYVGVRESAVTSSETRKRDAMADRIQDF